MPTLAPSPRRAVVARAASQPPPPPPPPLAPSPTLKPPGNGTLALILINIAIFVAAKAGLPFVSALALHHARPRAWQLVASAFVHLDGAHLGSNLFSLLLFGKAVEEEGGWFGVFLTYIVCALGANLASLAFLPRTSVSIGASGAVFGLIVVSCLSRLKLNLRSIVECGILTQFAVQQVLGEARAQAAGGTLTVGGATVSHVAHLAGAAAGVLLVLLLSRLPE